MHARIIFQEGIVQIVRHDIFDCPLSHFLYENRFLLVLASKL